MIPITWNTHRSHRSCSEVCKSAYTGTYANGFSPWFGLVPIIFGAHQQPRKLSEPFTMLSLHMEVLNENEEDPRGTDDCSALRNFSPARAGRAACGARRCRLDQVGSDLRGESAHFLRDR